MAEDIGRLENHQQRVDLIKRIIENISDNYNLKIQLVEMAPDLDNISRVWPRFKAYFNLDVENYEYRKSQINEVSDQQFIIDHIENKIGRVEDSKYVKYIQELSNDRLEKLTKEKDKEIADLKKQINERDGVINYLETNKNRKTSMVDTGDSNVL